MMTLGKSLSVSVDLVFYKLGLIHSLPIAVKGKVVIGRMLADLNFSGIGWFCSKGGFHLYNSLSLII